MEQELNRAKGCKKKTMPRNNTWFSNRFVSLYNAYIHWKKNQNTVMGSSQKLIMRSPTKHPTNWSFACLLDSRKINRLSRWDRTWGQTKTDEGILFRRPRFRISISFSDFSLVLTFTLVFGFRHPRFGINKRVFLSLCLETVEMSNGEKVII